MFIAHDWDNEKSPSGASSTAPMSLLTELWDLLLFDTYKHAAPLGLKHPNPPCA